MAEKEPPSPREPRSLEVRASWEDVEVGGNLLGQVEIPSVPAPCPRGWETSPSGVVMRCKKAMEQIYHLAPGLAMDLFVGEWDTKKAD